MQNGGVSKAHPAGFIFGGDPASLARTYKVQKTGGLDLREPKSERTKTILGTANHAQDYTSHRHQTRNHQTHWVAHFPPHLFDTTESNRRRYKSDAGTASTRLQPGDDGYIYPSRDRTKAKSSECGRPVFPQSCRSRGLIC